MDIERRVKLQAIATKLLNIMQDVATIAVQIHDSHKHGNDYFPHEQRDDLVSVSDDLIKLLDDVIPKEDQT